ncbi:MAG: MarR family winged helix-turn-helix transcriptional regulator [Acutalibacteraceae bacterium]
MKKDEILEETLKTLALAARANALNFFQINLKGENALLLQLIDSGGQSTPSVLAEKLGVSAARIAAMLRSLEIKKLIERVCDEKDKRRVTVKITEVGKQFVESISDTVCQRAQSLLERLGEKDAKEFLRLLKKCTGFDENLEVENEEQENGSEPENEDINKINNDGVDSEPEKADGEANDKG